GGLSTQNSFNATSPRDVAFDANGNAWFANLSGTATELNGLTGAAISPSTGYTISTTANSQSGVAVDSAGHVWISGMNGNVLYEMAVSNGAVLGASAYTAGGLEQPYSIAIDASNNIWLPNNYDPNTLVGNTVSKFTSVTTGTAHSGGGMLGPDGVAFVGAAVPVVTPISVAVKNGTIGARP